jgi:hypothetical protein
MNRQTDTEHTPFKPGSGRLSVDTQGWWAQFREGFCGPFVTEEAARDFVEEYLAELQAA